MNVLKCKNRKSKYNEEFPVHPRRRQETLETYNWRRNEHIKYPGYPSSSSNMSRKFLSGFYIIKGDMSEKDQTEEECG